LSRKPSLMILKSRSYPCCAANTLCVIIKIFNVSESAVFCFISSKILFKRIFNSSGANYELAKAEADKVDEKIIEALRDGHSFRVEAGAGSGKTYSLNRVIEWIQENMWSKYSRKKQNVVCITYTNAAVEVITERLSKDSFIIPSTICLSSSTETI
jgi:hypothetical protein